MSATTATNNKNQPAPARTSGRGAPVCITLGIFLLTLGCAWGISLIAGRDGYAMNQLCQMVQGLAGPLCPGLALLCVWGGVKLIVSARHRVSVRDILIVSGLYWLVLTMFSLVANVPAGSSYISYMEYVSKQVWSAEFLPHYSGSLHQAYLQGIHGAGGLLGMLIAYPLDHFLTRIGAILLVSILLIALFFALFRQNPTTLVHSILAFTENRRQKAALKRQQRAAEDADPDQDALGGAYAGPMDDPGSPAPADTPAPAFTPPSYYQPAPIYDTTPYEAPLPETPDEDGFYPVQAGAFGETIPAQPSVRREASAPIPWDEPEPVAEPAPAPVEPAPSRRRRRAQEAETVAEPAAPQAVPEIKKNPAAGANHGQTSTPAAGEPITATPPPEYHDKDTSASAGDGGSASRKRSPRREAPAPAPIPTVQALDEEEDDLPWDVPSYLSPSAASPVKAPITAAVPPPAAVPAAKKTASTMPASAGSGDDWASQVRSKQATLSEDFPPHTTRKNEPQVVHTDPAVPITGERVPITPKRDRQDPAARMDGTSAPTVRQQPAGWLVPYQAPPIRLLNEAQKVSQEGIKQEDETRAEIIENTLRSFGVESTVQRIMHGPSVTQFAIQIAPGIKVSRVTNTEKNLALELKAEHVRVETPIKGTNYIGIEVPNQLISTVSLREVLESPAMQSNPSPLLAALGKGISGEPVLCDLSKMPHLLIAGATGSGKSVCINSIICSLLYRTSPEQVRMIMIDPKQVELNVYNPIPHLLVPVISDPKKAAGALAWGVQEMLERYAKFSALQVRNIAGYNKAKQKENPDETLPNIVVVIDEMADLMEVCRKDVEESIRRLAALARAAGIYMVLATQRPSVDVITGVIKNNIPSRIAFAVSSGTDSRTIIDMNGAEKLMGKGDMLYKPTGATAVRVQGCFVSDEEVTAIAEHIGSRYQTDYDPNITEHLENTGKEPAADNAGDDWGYGGGGGGSEGEFKDLLQQAIEMAVEDGSTSTSMLQRRLRVGYARAGRLIDEMEKRGIISPYEGSKARKTLVTREQYAAMMQDE